MTPAESLSEVMRLGALATGRPTIDRLIELFYVREDGALIRRTTINNHGARAGDVAGAKNGQGYLIVRVDGGREMVHRIVYAITHKAWPLNHIDHIDGNKTNNLPSNLRDVSHSVNQQNLIRLRRKDGGYIGTSLNKRSGRWQARIVTHGVVAYLGSYNTTEAAYAAYINAKRIRHQAGRGIDSVATSKGADAGEGL